MKRSGEPVAGPMGLFVQGVEMELLYSEEVAPTVFSMILANTMSVRADARLAFDLGTGGGVLAIALARLGVPKVIAVDRSTEACEIARENAARNGVADRVEVVEGDIADVDLGVRADQIVVNPPTLPDQPHVPAFADGGGLDGLDFLRALFRRLPEWLAPAGRAQIVLSSLVMSADEFKGRMDGSITVEPLATIVAPFRTFYRNAYDSEEVEGFVGAGQALPGGGAPAPDVSELVTVYNLDRLRRE